MLLVAYNATILIRECFKMINKKILADIEKYIKDENLSNLEIRFSVNQLSQDDQLSKHYKIHAVENKRTKNESTISYKNHTDIDSFIENHKKPTFQEKLFSFIDDKELKDSDVYKKAGIDRRLFSKIRCNKKYHPSKGTAIALALALELSKQETNDLLISAGYFLSKSSTFDLIIHYFIEHRIYDLNDLNIALDYFSLEPIGSVIE